MSKAEIDRLHWIRTFYPVPESAAIAMVAAGLTDEQISTAVVAWTNSGGLVDLDNIIKLLLMETPMPKPEDWQNLGRVIASSPTHPGTRQRREYAESLLAEFTGIRQGRRQ